jgi:uncharacterized protein
MGNLPAQRQSEESHDDADTGHHLVVFVKAPRVGQVKTRLASAIGEVAACAAYRQLAAALLGRIAAIPDVELCYSPDDAAGEIEPWLRNSWRARPQGSGDLGQRLIGAFEHAFAPGSRRVVIIGSDCAEISADDIRMAWSALRTRDVVLGPARDGGYWLIGLRMLHRELFEDIPWSTENVLNRTVGKARAAGLKIELLRELSDVDTFEDWKRFVDSTQRGGGEGGG